MTANVCHDSLIANFVKKCIRYFCVPYKNIEWSFFSPGIPFFSNGDSIDETRLPDEYTDYQNISFRSGVVRKSTYSLPILKQFTIGVYTVGLHRCIIHT